MDPRRTQHGPGHRGRCLANLHLNPATSIVLHEWDRRGVHDLELRADLLAELREEQMERVANPLRQRANSPVEV